ncbi:MAG: ABC transporter permease [Hydrotalea sp.]|nr:ABC transporter permease [Hydrotalea sp.]
MLNSFKIILSYIFYRPFYYGLQLLTFATGVGLIVGLLLTQSQLEKQFTSNLAGVNLVVGAKGSPLQIIMSSIFQLDIPTGNIDLKEVNQLTTNPQSSALIKMAIPLAFGDNYQAVRIVGTTPDYINLYNGKLASGVMYQNPLEVVIGADVARKLKLKIGDSFTGSHGIVPTGANDDAHTVSPYKVVGILTPSNTVLDRLILTPVESVWLVHERDAISEHRVMMPRAITSLLVIYKSPMGAALLPRMVNDYKTLQAANPAFEISRLINFMGVGTGALVGLGYFLILLAGIGMVSAMIQALRERQYDWALLRSFGMARGKLISLVFGESLLVALMGAVFGVLLGHLFYGVIGYFLAADRYVNLDNLAFLPQELWVVGFAFLIGGISAIIPAYRLLRGDIIQLLIKK